MRLPAPSVGWPAYIALGVIYFSTSYLLLGSIFLGIGAHASTAREVQVISMPITMAQVLVFALSAISIGDQHSNLAIAVAIFPLSSPYVMFARAAELPDLWPHVVAVVWQLLCVVVLLRIASKLFRRSVLKSGPTRASKRRAARA
jgi:ABC-2 type transport system permease protein